MKSIIEKAQGFTADSREVKPGYMFIAIKSSLHDGHHYINNSIASGAKFIIHQDKIEQDSNVTYVQVKDTRLSYSKIAKDFYSKQPNYILGITGTSGKSSTVHFVRELLKLLDIKSISIGTMGVMGDLEFPLDLTTPSPKQLHQILHTAKENEIDYTAIECSSHGIDQHRISSVNFTACAFTNFSQDHLDYHLTMKKYLTSKLKLFKLMKPGFAVLNSDIPEFDAVKKSCEKHKLICYGKTIYKEAEHNITIVSIQKRDLKQFVIWKIDGKLYKTEVNLVGEFQIYNIACAIGLLISSGIKENHIMPLLSQLSTVTGRLELVATYNGASIFIDYAHKPDALLSVLQTVKQSTDNDLWLLFGCGGERDATKRKIMGEIACDYADRVVITEDNPRKEDASAIRKDILEGCNEKAIEIPGRGNAITYALSRLNPGDKLIIAGKGHEDYQIIGDTKISFSDAEIVKEYVSLS